MKFKILTLIMLCLSFVSMEAQRNCGSMEYLDQQIENSPERMKNLQIIENHLRNFEPTDRNNPVITIPIVFHVVYRTASENLSLAQLQTQLDVLNEDFRRLNSDATNDYPQASDLEIEFCLATVDPNGNATTGVTRTSTSVNGFGTNDAVKFTSSGGIDAWPSDSYLNFWVCNIGGGILGYAQFPGGAAATDGVVNDYRYTGTIGTAQAPFDLGRTATHEVGHWLNLRHIWGDGGCGVDDFVSDTPLSDGPNYGCASNHSSCGTPDMVENYMDYSDDACMNLFTEGQKLRCRALFGPGGFREALLNSNGCGSGNPPTCTDGTQNGNETGVDCGGTDCPACPTCSDGVQNGDETGVDCGGSCAACPSNCTDNEVTVTITLDNYPEETSWTITNASGSTVASGGTYGSQPDGSTVVIVECLLDGCYDFTINDSYGDGICCAYGSGSYAVTSGGSTLASGGSFGSSETTNFCFGSGPAPTCTDGVQNGNETGVDCGGPDCPACPTCNDGVQNGNETGVDCGGPDCSACPTCNDGVQNGNETGVDCGGPDCSPCNNGGTDVLSGDFFESGWDGWTDGGTDCARYNGSRSWEGNRSIRLRDNSGTSSAMTSSNYDLTPYNSVDVEFYFYAWSMENGEDFWLRYYDGSSWQTVATYARGTSFNNNTFYTATVTLSSADYNFASNSRFRFQCDASGNSDHVYIDAVTVTATGSGTRTGGSSLTKMYENLNEISEEAEMTIMPNPATDRIMITTQEEITKVSIYNTTGQLIYSTSNLSEMTYGIDVSRFDSGLYILYAETEDEMMKDKFIKH